MESERHAFMRKLLSLCVETGVDFYVEQVCDTSGRLWIGSIDVHMVEQRIIGYWDGERHEVQL